MIYLLCDVFCHYFVFTCILGQMYKLVGYYCINLGSSMVNLRGLGDDCRLIPKFKQWDRSHSCSEVTNGIDPIGVLRPPMGSIPYVSSYYLWDRSHRCPQITYGIDPIGVLRSPMGLIQYLIWDSKI